MNNPFTHWWCRYKLKQALKKGDRQKAKILLQQAIRGRKNLTWWESLFYEQIKQEKSQQELQQKKFFLEHQVNASVVESFYLSPDITVINEFFKIFKIIQYQQHQRQITGINEALFDLLELQLVNYLKQEFSQKSNLQTKTKLKEALDDLNQLKKGQDPSYAMELSPHIYFIKYFLENIYSLYLTWLLVYENGLFSPKLKILDIAAGPATAAYGLSLFLQNLNELQEIPETHISYFSLERRKNLQYRGLQFWRKYNESQHKPINAYFRFVTEDIFEYSNWRKKVPENFFEVIIVSHCFSSDPSSREKFQIAYQEIFDLHLTAKGFVILIIQDKKLFNMYDTYFTSDSNQEKKVIQKFVTEFNLSLIDYQYFRSTPFDVSISNKEFGTFASQYLPPQKHIHNLFIQYLDQKFQSHYTLDDYVILAKK